MKGTVEAAISRELIAFYPETPVGQAIASLVVNNISGTPVLNDVGALAGILTAKDCFRAALQCSYHGEWEGLVSDFMTTQVYTLDADTDLVTAASRFLEVNFRRFPVLRDEKVIGMVTRFDVLRTLYNDSARSK